MTSDRGAADPRANPASAALTGPAVAGITRLSATDTVRGRIALAIELGLLKPAEQLPSDAQIGEALKVSEITARRALESLAEDGLVVRRRGRRGGTFVAERDSASGGVRTAGIDAVDAYRADAAEVHRLIDARLIAETALSHFAALDATNEQLETIAVQVVAAGAAQNWSDYHAADEGFHLAVAEASGRPWARGAYIEVLHGLYRYFLPYPIDHLHRANDDHARLLEALRAHDPVAAVAITEAHVGALHETMFVGLADR